MKKAGKGVLGVEKKVEFTRTLVRKRLERHVLAKSKGRSEDPEAEAFFKIVEDVSSPKETIAGLDPDAVRRLAGVHET